MQDFYNVMQLLCAVLAECFYTGASITFKAIKCLQHHLGPFHPLIFLVQESWWLPTQQGGAWPLDGSSLCNFQSVQSFSSHFFSQLEEGATAQDLARAQVSAGDATMTRLWEHVKAVCPMNKTISKKSLTKGSKIPKKQKKMSSISHLQVLGWREDWRADWQKYWSAGGYSPLSQICKVVFSPLLRISHGVMPTSCMRSTSGSEGQS